MQEQSTNIKHDGAQLIPCFNPGVAASRELCEHKVYGLLYHVNFVGLAVIILCVSYCQCLVNFELVILVNLEVSIIEEVVYQWAQNNDIDLKEDDQR